jgi:hypothetical protein
LHKEISFTEDICKLVSQEAGVPEQKVLHHIEFLVHWIKTLASSPEYLNIRIPHIGYLYLNVSKIEKLVDYFSKSKELNKNSSDLLELNRRRLQNFSDQFQDVNTYSRHKKKYKLTNKYFTKGKSFKDLEEWQNK